MKNILVPLFAVFLFISCYNTKQRSSDSSYQWSSQGRGLAGLSDSGQDREGYDIIVDNAFHEVIKHPLSTFSIDVDGASYSNSRRFISGGSLPPPDAVRVEEFINYFNYAYTAPSGSEPFAVNSQLSDCPWNEKHKLLHIGLQGARLEMENTPASNLVFLLDVSGSMNDPNKLPLLKSSFGLLVDQLDQDDRIAIVVYAGASGLILPPTTCDQKETILMALDNLSAGGSTAGAEGIQLAYKTARESFISEGNNRIILATDGDFNVGVSSDAELQRLVEKNREDGIFLSIFGFGTGNLQDAKMEKMADNGNGNYYYIDSMFEAQKVLVSEIGGTLHVIAKDVKIQVEFNPAKVHSYRLIGYENRLLEEEDFDNDKKDAGELGAGHTVTALYEIVPNALDAPVPVTEYRYQSVKVNDGAYNSSEIGNLKLRCKPPTGTVSLLTEIPLIDSHLALGDTEDYFRFSAAVAEFGMLLRDSEYKGNSSYEQVLALAAGAKGADEHGYRQEFIKLVKIAESLASTSVSTGK